MLICDGRVQYHRAFSVLIPISEDQIRKSQYTVDVSPPNCVGFTPAEGHGGVLISVPVVVATMYPENGGLYFLCNLRFVLINCSASPGGVRSAVVRQLYPARGGGAKRGCHVFGIRKGAV